jgi:hypothetical protein
MKCAASVPLIVVALTLSRVVDEVLVSVTLCSPGDPKDKLLGLTDALARPLASPESATL